MRLSVLAFNTQVELVSIDDWITPRPGVVSDTFLFAGGFSFAQVSDFASMSTRELHVASIFQIIIWASLTTTCNTGF